MAIRTKELKVAKLGNLVHQMKTVSIDLIVLYSLKQNNTSGSFFPDMYSYLKQGIIFNKLILNQNVWLLP